MNNSILSFICEICTNEKTYEDCFTIKGCSHFYCSDCISQYIISKLEQMILRIPCPFLGCCSLLNPKSCRSIIEHKVFDKWSEALIRKFVPERGELLLHKLATTQNWKQCPGCNIYIEKSALNREWSGEEAELNPAYELRFEMDKILDVLAESCNSMKCRWCGCIFCYSCGISDDDPRGHKARETKCGQVYVPPLIGSPKEASTMKNAEEMSIMMSSDETSIMKGCSDEMLIMKSSDETSTMKSAKEASPAKGMPSWSWM